MERGEWRVGGGLGTEKVLKTDITVKPGPSLFPSYTNSLGDFATFLPLSGI